MRVHCNRRKFIIVLAALTALLLAAEGNEPSDQVASAKDLTYITEQYPPYNFQKNGELQGISVYLLEAVWQKMGLRA